MWTKSDQKQLEELQARKAQFEATHKSHVIDFVQSMPNLPDAGITPMVDHLIANADLLRDVLKPFDSGVRVGERFLDVTGWIEWHGGKCPVDTRFMVEVRTCDGILFTDRAVRLDWERSEGAAHIVAYRVVE